MTDTVVDARGSSAARGGRGRRHGPLASALLATALVAGMGAPASGAAGPGRPFPRRGPAGTGSPDRVNCNAIAGQPTSFYEDDLTYVDPVDDSATWHFATPASQGMDVARLDGAARELAGQGELASFVVLRNGAMVYERYFHGSNRHAANNVHSASKSMLSAAVGIAIQQGAIRSVDQRVATLLPTYFARLGADKQQMKLRHLLTMTSGLDWTEDSTEYDIETRPDWVAAILGRPLNAPPGSTFNYSTGSAHVVSAALTHATGMSTCDFVHRNLFGPLGITAEHWGRDPQGVFSGGYNLFLTPREMAKFGQLYLDGGRWKGRQVVPASWVATSTTSKVDAGGYGYGYYWWLTQVNGHDLAIAWGFGGQFIYIVRDLHLVVVMTTDTRNHTIDFNGESILQQYVVPSISGG